MFIGIGAGELVLWLFGGGYGRLALATFVATLLARLVGGPRLVIVQAAGSAILTVASADGQVGMNRMVDALIGAGVALVGSQFLFSPEPVALVRRAEVTALRTMAKAVDLVADALASDDDLPSERSLTALQILREDLAELARFATPARGLPATRSCGVGGNHRRPRNPRTPNTSTSSGSAASPSRARPWQSRSTIEPWSCRSHATSSRNSPNTIAADPGDRSVRLAVIRERGSTLICRTSSASHWRRGAQLTAACMALRLAFVDLIVFAGVKPQRCDGDARGRHRRRRCAHPRRRCPSSRASSIFRRVMLAVCCRPGTAGGG